MGCVKQNSQVFRLKMRLLLTPSTELANPGKVCFRQIVLDFGYLQCLFSRILNGFLLFKAQLQRLLPFSASILLLSPRQNCSLSVFPQYPETLVIAHHSLLEFLFAPRQPR